MVKKLNNSLQSNKFVRKPMKWKQASHTSKSGLIEETSVQEDQKFINSNNYETINQYQIFKVIGRYKSEETQIKN